MKAGCIVTPKGVKADPTIDERKISIFMPSERFFSAP
jgi:hypothetical protein